MAELKAFDTNILIYAFDIDEEVKHIKAKELFDSVCKDEMRGVLSIQNLTELFYWFVKSKKVKIELAESVINDFIESKQWVVKDLDINRLKLGMSLTKKYKIHFWDALICANAILEGVDEIYTENVQDFKSDLIKAVNPFIKSY